MIFQRNYKLLIITPKNKQITITPPLSVVFSLTRNTLSSANRCQIKIYNLGKNTRSQIYKDKYITTEYWRIILSAGYGNEIKEIFTGNIYEANSTKEKTDWITTIDCFDGLDAIQNGFTSQTVSKNTSVKDMIKNVINDMPNVVSGFFGEKLEGESERGQVLIGQSSGILTELTDGNYFIDNETVNILTDDEVIKGEVLVLDPKILLATPKRQDTMLSVPVLFLPEIQVGQVCEIQSLEEIYNGQYKVMGFSHSVTISQAIAGNARTEIQLYYGANGLKEVSR